MRRHSEQRMTKSTVDYAGTAKVTAAGMVDTEGYSPANICMAALVGCTDHHWIFFSGKTFVSAAGACVVVAVAGTLPFAAGSRKAAKLPPKQDHCASFVGSYDIEVIASCCSSFLGLQNSLVLL